MLEGKAESTESIPPRKRRLRRNPVTNLAGLIEEAGRIYRQMKKRKIPHEEGRSLMWSLSQIRPMLEAQQLEQMNARLEELAQLAESRYGPAGSSGREQLRLN